MAHSTSLLESHLDLTCTCHGNSVASPRPSLEESSILRPSRPGAAEGEEVPVGALCVIEDSNNGVEGRGGQWAQITIFDFDLQDHYW